MPVEKATSTESIVITIIKKDGTKQVCVLK